MTTRCEPRRDRYGRYLLPDPATGKDRAYTRTTTLAKTLSDTSALDRWKRRQTLIGLAADLDLLEQAITTAARDPDDRDALDHLAERALTASGAGAAADRGTELHALTEGLDAGEDTVIPEWARDDTDAYMAVTRGYGLGFRPEWIERLVINEPADVAGTFDRIVTLPDGRHVIGDLKTGQDLRYSWGDIACQLAIYANAGWMVEPDGQSLVPLPDIDRSIGLVIHLPVGKGACHLFELDLAAGWAAVRTALDVKAWRAESRNLAKRLTAL